MSDLASTSVAPTSADDDEALETTTTVGSGRRAQAGKRLLLVLLPAAVLAGFGATAIWGENGLLVRHTLAQQIEASQSELGRLNKENERLLLELNAMERDPVVIERMVADEIGWAQEGAVVVKFE